MPDPYFGAVGFLLNFNDGTVNDLKGHTVTAVGAGNGATTAQKKFGTHGAALVRASGGSIQIADGSDLEPGSGSWTVEAWVYSTSANAQYIFHKSNNASINGPIHLLLGTGTGSQKLTAYLSKTGSLDLILTDPAVWQLNTWIHVALVRNGNAVTLYKNGTSVASGAVSGALVDNAHPWILGNAATTISAGAAFDGFVDDVRYTLAARPTTDFNYLAAAPTNAVGYRVPIEIVESLPVADWRVRVHRLDTGALLSEDTRPSGSSSVEILVAPPPPVTITVMPDITSFWSASTTKTTGARVYPTNPAANPAWYYVTSPPSGTAQTGSTEPAWPTAPGSTVVDGGITWTRGGDLVQPITQGPLIPEQYVN